MQKNLRKQQLKSRILTFLHRFKTYYWAHVLYYLMTTLIFATLMFAVEYKDNGFSWLDCWFTITSAHTVTGLGVLDFTKTHSVTKVVCAVLLCLGGQVAFALVPLVLRRFHFLWINRKTNNAAIWQDLLDVLTARTEVKMDFLDKKYLMFRATGLLIKILLLYAFIFNGLGILVLALYAGTKDSVGEKLDGFNVSPMYFATFTTLSAFNNAGFSVFSSSLAPFRTDPCVLFSAMVLIVAGNTGFPIFLRTLVYTLQQIHLWRENRRIKQGKGAVVDYQNMMYKSLLLHPRMYTTHMFETFQTRILLFVLLATNILQFILYTSVSSGEDVGIDSPAQKALQMGFTTISTRTAGFNVLPLEFLNPGILICQVMFMYLASYPLIVAVQSTSLKRTTVNTDARKGDDHSIKHTSKGAVEEVRTILRNDILWLAGGCLLIAFDPFVTLESLFRVIWEVISAYGTVGSSLSYSTQVSSFSSSFHNVAKLTVIVIMIIGRHRSVPKNVDEAVETILTTEELRRSLSLTRLEADLRPLIDQHAYTIGHAMNPVYGVDNRVTLRELLGYHSGGKPHDDRPEPMEPITEGPKEEMPPKDDADTEIEAPTEIEATKKDVELV